jgi:4-diphosphocytidyl-2-C-methyl-D-erythritol kinase
VVVFPNCKINLGLNVTGKRADGFHDIETVFYPVSLQDALEIIIVNGAKDNIRFSTSGTAVFGQPDDNLCIRAYRLLKNDFQQMRPVEMHLHKTVPVGAGLGGGSGDGAFTLLVLNQLFNLGLSENKLVEYALKLGSDCPFFILNKPCFATGRGETLEPIELDLSAYKLVVANPGIHINTTEAFSMITPAIPSKSIKQIIKQPVETWKVDLKNDFEESIFNKYNEIKSIKEQLYEKGAIYASMTGSGSSVYGLFKKETDIQPTFPPNYFIKTILI